MADSETFDVNINIQCRLPKYQSVRFGCNIEFDAKQKRLPLICCGKSGTGKDGFA
jgi:hypothetical protein